MMISEENMKTIVSIGSTFTNKVLSLVKENLRHIKSYLSISPISFLEKTDTYIDNLEATNSEAYREDINKLVFEELTELKPDYILIDLLDFRLPVEKIRFSDKSTDNIVTWNSGIEKALEKRNYQKIESLNPLEFSESELMAIMQSYVEHLLDICDGKRIVVLEAKPAFISISKNNKLYNLGDQVKASELNRFFERIYTILRLIAPNLCYIPFPNVWYCDERESRPFSYYLSASYYKYSAEALMAYVLEDQTYKIKEECKKLEKILLSKVEECDPRKKLWKNVELINFNGIYKDDFGNNIDTNGQEINIYLFGENNSIKVGDSCDIQNLKIRLVRNNEIIIGEGCTTHNNSLDLENSSKVILGNKCDFQEGGSISLKNRSSFSMGDFGELRERMNASILSNAHFEAGEKCILFWNSRLNLNDNSIMKVGRGTTAQGNNTFFCYSNTEIVIGNDCMFSSDIVVMSGDGHAIFDMETKEKTNDFKKLPREEKIISISDHVWVGRRATILTRTKIGAGSLVGAGALCKGIFPNNCIIAGCPAKVIKKNICWSRNDNAKNLEDCETYTNMTGDFPT